MLEDKTNGREKMKKLLLVLSIIGIFTACGTPKVKLTTSEYKNEVIEKIVEKNDVKAKKEYEEIKAELKVAMEKGSIEAKKEYEEWAKIYKWKNFITVKKTNTPRTLDW